MLCCWRCTWWFCGHGSFLRRHSASFGLTPHGSLPAGCIQTPCPHAPYTKQMRVVVIGYQKKPLFNHAEMVALRLWVYVVITLICLGCCCALCGAVGDIIVCAVIGSCPCWPSVLCSDFRLLFLFCFTCCALISLTAECCTVGK